MRGSRSGICLFAAVTLVVAGIGSTGKAEGWESSSYYSPIVVANASLVANSPSDIPRFSDSDVYALTPSVVVDSSQGENSAKSEQVSPVPEPSGIVLGAFFAALFALVSLLRWRFDQTATQS